MKTIASNEINCAEHEYMNMCPPPQLLICYATEDTLKKSLQAITENNDDDSV